MSKAYLQEEIENSPPLVGCQGLQGFFLLVERQQVRPECLKEERDIGGLQEKEFNSIKFNFIYIVPSHNKTTKEKQGAGRSRYEHETRKQLQTSQV